jgi:RNA polymerase sigma-70 factor (ECF subfamily)
MPVFLIPSPVPEIALALRQLVMGEQGVDLYNVSDKIIRSGIWGVSTSTHQSIRRLMRAFRQGDRNAGSALADLFYPELRRMAADRMRGERSEHTWQPTALVHELYLEIAKVRSMGTPSDSAEEERAAFLRIAGHMMKRLLIHHARPLYRRAEHVEISDDIALTDGLSDSLQDVEDALSRLAAVNPRLRAVVEMKVFEGLTGDEIARQLGCSRGTISNCWTFAQRWLQEEWSATRRP